MKNFLLIIAIITLIFSVQGQSDSSHNIVDAYIGSWLYDIDTSINFYSKAELNWIDTTGGSSSYNFLEGNETYCEVSIKKLCKCHDGSTHQIIIVQFNNLDSSQVVELTPSNTSCLVRSTWNYQPFVYFSSRTLDFKNHTLQFNPWLDLDRNVLWPAMIIKNVLLTKPNLH